jgi:hypothetical protein
MQSAPWGDQISCTPTPGVGGAQLTVECGLTGVPTAHAEGDTNATGEGGLGAAMDVEIDATGDSVARSVACFEARCSSAEEDGPAYEARVPCVDDPQLPVRPQLRHELKLELLASL